MRNFTRVEQCGGTQRWQRNDKPEIFVSHYPACGSRPGVFYVYRAVERVPAGRKPWTVDNRRICAPRAAEGRFHSLPAAFKFAEAA